ncbi:MAG: STAS domain-containing protein [Candidatus Nanopelagicales bacterium]
MEITTSDNGTATVVAVTGELDVYTAPELETALNDLIGQGRSDLVIDLSGVDFLDSTGLGVMVKALKWAREAGGGLRVVATQERITKVFTITGLDEVMSLSGSVD